MCVAAIAWCAHPRWLIVAIGNRDEYHARPAATIARWQDRPDIIAGRDLKSGGTWLGVSDAGRFALVTNRRGFGDPDPTRASRGDLVAHLLDRAGAYADHRTAPLAQFNPFNLILAERDGAYYISNRPDEVRTALTHGIYGISNGGLDEPWPKTLQLKAALIDWLNEDAQRIDPLFAALANERLEDVGIHPREPSDVAREAPETPVFIRDPVYGTRCSTIVTIDREGKGRISERSFSAEGKMTGERSLDFVWSAGKATQS